MIWYRAKVLRVLRDDFDYKPAVPGLQSVSFNAVTRHIRKQGGNEYDGAIGFMLVQCNALMTMSGDDAEAQAFVVRIQSIAERLMPNANCDLPISSAIHCGAGGRVRTSNHPEPLRQPLSQPVGEPGKALLSMFARRAIFDGGHRGAGIAGRAGGVAETASA
jgi:hypothetical protein